MYSYFSQVGKCFWLGSVYEVINLIDIAIRLPLAILLICRCLIPLRWLRLYSDLLFEHPGPPGTVKYLPKWEDPPLDIDFTLWPSAPNPPSPTDTLMAAGPLTWTIFTATSPLLPSPFIIPPHPPPPPPTASTRRRYVSFGTKKVVELWKRNVIGSPNETKIVKQLKTLQ